jgi:hypothetical protein
MSRLAVVMHNLTANRKLDITVRQDGCSAFQQEPDGSLWCPVALFAKYIAGYERHGLSQLRKNFINVMYQGYVMLHTAISHSGGYFRKCGNRFT